MVALLRAALPIVFLPSLLISAAPLISRDVDSVPVSTTVSILTTESDSSHSPFNSTGIEASIPTYLPALPLSVDPSDLSNLEPVSTGALYYTPDGSADPTQSHRFGHLHNNYSYPAVIAEHSSLISSIECTASGLSITLSTSQAYIFVKSQWTNTPFLFITHSHGCADPEAVGERSYWLVSSTSYEDTESKVNVVADAISVEVAFESTEMTWGHYTPGTTESSAAVDSPTSTVSGSTASSTASCPQPPAATVSGFPTAPLCEDFDDLLDEQIGYFDFDDNTDFTSALQHFAPGLDAADYDDEEYEYDYFEYINGTNYNEGVNGTDALNGTTLVRRRVANQKRINIPPFLAKVATIGIKLQTVVPRVALIGLEKIAPAPIANKIKQYTTIDKAGNTFVKQKYNTSDNGGYETPYGKALKLYSIEKNETTKGITTPKDTKLTFTLSCVGCGFDAAINIDGKLNIDFKRLTIEQGSINMKGSIMTEANFLLEAQFALEKKAGKEFLNIPLPGLAIAIPNFATIGPALVAKAEAGISLKAQGGILGGGKVFVPNFTANIDVVKGTASTTGFDQAKFVPRFDAYGQVSATLGFEVPVTVGLLLKVQKLDINRNIALTAKTEIASTVAYTLGTGNVTCNNGVNWEVKLEQTLNFEYGKPNSPFKLFSKEIAKVDGCIPFKKSSKTRSLMSKRQSGNSSAVDESDHVDAVNWALSDSDDGIDYDDEDTFNEDFYGGAANVTDEQMVTDVWASAAIAAAQAEQSLPDVIDGGKLVRIQSQWDSNVFGEDVYGNFYLFNGSDPDSQESKFVAYDSIIVSTDDNEVFHYYTDTMETFGVSRFRGSGFDEIPVTADMITFVAINGESNSTDIVNSGPILFPVSTSGDYFYTVICDYTTEDPAKFFLVKDIDAGIQTLTNPDLQYILTGGPVQACEFWPLVAQIQGVDVQDEIPSEITASR